MDLGSKEEVLEPHHEAVGDASVGLPIGCEKKAWTVSALVEASILMLGTSMETAAGQKSHVEGIPRFELPVAVLNEAGLQLWRPASPSNATLSVFAFLGLLCSWSGPSA